MHCISVAFLRVQPTIEPSDAELLEGIREGDEAAFRRLYDRHASYLAGVAYRLLGNDSELEDVVQEAFLEAIRFMHRVREPDRLRSWLVTVTVRRVRRRLRKRRSLRRLAAAIAPVAPRVSDPEEGAEVDAVYRALDHVDPQARIPWILHHVQGATLPETAALCETSLSTVKRRIADAKRQLDRRLAC